MLYTKYIKSWKNCFLAGAICFIFDNGPIKIIQTEVEFFFFFLFIYTSLSSWDEVPEGRNHLYKPKKHLASLVTRRYQDKVLRKSMSFKDKSTHAFRGQNGWTDTQNWIAADLLQEQSTTTSTKATKGRIEKKGKIITNQRPQNTQINILVT